MNRKEKDWTVKVSTSPQSCLTSAWPLVWSVGTFYRKLTWIWEVQGGWDCPQKCSSQLSEACSPLNLWTDIRHEQTYTFVPHVGLFILLKTYILFAQLFKLIHFQMLFWHKMRTIIVPLSFVIKVHCGRSLNGQNEQAECCQPSSGSSQKSQF